MAMTRGYPPEADIDTFLAERGLEIPTEGNANYIAEFKQFLWGILNKLDWAGTLAVYAATSTTFNVAGGDYLYRGTVKTYTPGSAVNPTDNDTTYVWLTPTNTISSGIDGDGWPNSEHVKLAEVDVDSDGIITQITDMRGRAFMEYGPIDSVIDRIVTHDGDVVTYEGNVIYY